MKVPRGMLRKRRDSMSQAKVDRYKQEKKNRDKIIKKEKRQLAAMKAGVSVVAIALVACGSAYQSITDFSLRIRRRQRSRVIP